MLHRDQGAAYTSHAYYLACIEKGIIRSMSRKGTPPDNACIEWFHSALKAEIFYLHKRRKYNKDRIANTINNYITFYNETKSQRHFKKPIFCSIQEIGSIRVFFFYPIIEVQHL